MADKHTPKELPPDAKSDQEKEAKVELQEYKKRRERSADTDQAKASFGTALPRGPQMTLGPWPSNVIPSGGRPPYAPGGPFTAWPFAMPLTESASSLLGGLGLTLRLGIDLLNSGL